MQLAASLPGNWIRPVFSLWLCVKIRTHLFDIRQRWYVADGRVASLSVVVAHTVVHHCDQIIETLGFQEQRVSLAFEMPVEGPHLWIVLGSPQRRRPNTTRFGWSLIYVLS